MKIETIDGIIDVDPLIEEFYESGLVQLANVWSRAVIASLKKGVNYAAECAEIVRQKAAEQDKPFSCEELWQSAAEILGI